MQEQTEERLLEALIEIRNWVRVATRGQVGTALEAALPDAKSRLAYQMFDGSTSIEQVRVACKMSPNVAVALAGRCVSMGLMEITDEKRRVRLFDLNDFGLLNDDDPSKLRPKK
jgi:hypothetical protein